MSLNRDNLLLEIRIDGSNPRLLEGLEIWLQLGLLSDAQVRELSRNSLICPWQTPVVAPISQPQPAKSPLTLPQSAEPVPFWMTISQSLKSGISVRWLLFLGVFMVVVSSGLLVASKWKDFPATGQYLVLFSYTLIFWLVSRWTKQKPNLTLTAQTLGIVTLLLIPINFWAMDGFKLWTESWGWVTMIIATVILTLIIQGAGLFSSVPLLLVCYLQWGWYGDKLPLFAVYLGTLATVADTVTVYRAQKENSQKSLQLSQTSTFISLYALVILFGRGILTGRVEIPQLGLAIGLFGWLLTWLSHQDKNAHPLRAKLGAGIMFLGWLVSVGEFPLQAIAVSGLVLLWLRDRLLQRWQPLDLALIFGIGLQTFYLTGTVIPYPWRQTVINILLQLAQLQYYSNALLGIIWFPYLLGMLWVTGWLYRQKKRLLAQFGDKLALGFGIVLTLLAIENSAVLALNLLFSTITLGYEPHERRNAEKGRVYLTHIYGLLTIAAFIDWQFPGLSFNGWIVIILTLMVGEWIGANLGKFSGSLPIYQRSAWHIGLFLAGLSYILLLEQYEVITQNYSLWSLVWFLTPLSLTIIAGIGRNGVLPAHLSIIALVLAQVFTITQPGIRLIGLGLATILMLFNTRSS